MAAPTATGHEECEERTLPRQGGARCWRGAQAQVALVGVLAFCGPGLFNALTGLGSAGSDDPDVAAVANGCLYCVFAVSSYLAGVAFNIFGPLPLFVVGGSTYAVYAVCVYFSDKYSFLSAVGGIVLGLGAGLFWTAQGSLMMAYASPQSRGRLIALFWVIFNLGGVVGGLVQFGLNYDNEAGSANPTSYFAFIVMMLCGALLAPCVLVRPSQVVKEDGSFVVFERAASPSAELAAAARAFGDPFIRRCLLFFFASNWFYTYEFSGFNGTQFNVRTRGLNSALFWAAQMIAARLFGLVLDGPQMPVERAKRGMLLVVFMTLVSMIPAILNSFESDCDGARGWDKAHACYVDFAEDFPSSLLPMVVFVLLGAADAVYQNYAYWMMSTVAGDDVGKVVQYSAVYKGTQSIGAGVAWLTDLVHGFSYRRQGIVCLVLVSAALIPVVPTFRLLKQTHDGVKSPGAGKERPVASTNPRPASPA